MTDTTAERVRWPLVVWQLKLLHVGPERVEAMLGHSLSALSAAEGERLARLVKLLDGRCDTSDVETWFAELRDLDQTHEIAAEGWKGRLV